MVQNKKQMTEEDIKRLYITPHVEAKWDKNKITMETPITDGKINLRGNMHMRAKPKKADYVLYVNKYKPIAIVEAKDNKHPVGYGLQQAMTYAHMLDVPFAYSSNGDAFREHDFLTGMEREIALEDFPTAEELIARWETGANQGTGLTDLEKKIIAQPFFSSQNTYDPRYYQRNAVNRSVEAIARGQKRLLLVMATGTGKTYTAFQIVYRLLKAGMIKKVLYLADRNILVDQSIQQDFAPLGNTIHKVNFSKDDRTTITSYEVYFSLYQQLAGNDENEEENSTEDVTAKFAQLFDKDFFDLIIVDECHRGSAKKDSNWRKILEYFSSATQIGMTATPKETKSVSNIDYFGDPVYIYSLKEGIEDGFLAPFKVINIQTNIGDGWRPIKGQVDAKGQLIEDRIYNNSDYDTKIILEARRKQVAEEITKYLKTTGRMQKTIVFCANEEHAQAMRDLLMEMNSDMNGPNKDYVVRITGSDLYGKSQLDYFISVSSEYPVIATTSKLLSTGADCKMTKLIVLDEMINSMTEFKQIIGRGTRLREADGKTHFTIMDFRNVTRLFADPDWDGEITIDPDYPPKTGDGTGGDGNGGKPPYPTGENEKYYVKERDAMVYVTSKMVSIYDANGKLLRQESIVDYTKENIRGEYATLDEFINRWNGDKKQAVIREFLEEKNIDIDKLKADQGMKDVDDYDFVCHLAYDQKPLTRKQRADIVKKGSFFNRLSEAAKQVISTLLDKYCNAGIYDLEKPNILQLDDFRKIGKPAKIMSLFGGKAGYEQTIKELENEIYDDKLG